MLAGGRAVVAGTLLPRFLGAAGTAPARLTTRGLGAGLRRPLPVRLVEVSSLNVTSRTWWRASMDQCLRTK